MAHKKGGGSSTNGRDSCGKRLGVKAFDGQRVNGGAIIVRQRGNKFFPGENVGEGKDNTLYAKIPGILKFYTQGHRRYISIIPLTESIAEEPVASG